MSEPMQTSSATTLLVAMFAASATMAADQPGPLASADTKLDYLLQTWKGRTLEELNAVWGEASSVRAVGVNNTYVFEKISRVRVGPSIFTGQVKVETGAVTCIAYFEVGGAKKIVRVTRSGGGKPCWKAFKGRKPPR